MPGAWRNVREFVDIKYEHFEGIAKITINRPEVRNAFRPETIFELQEAFAHVRDDPTIGVVLLTGEGPARLLLGRRPAHPRRRRLRRPGRRPAAERARPPAPDSRAAQARDRHGRRLRHRRRPRPARRVRPDHRRRQRALRPDRPARRQLRRRLRLDAAGPTRRRQEGQGNLVPVPPVLGPGSPRHGPGQRRRAARPSSKTRPSSGRARSWRRARRPSASSKPPSTPRPRAWPACSSSPATPRCSTT